MPHKKEQNETEICQNYITPAIKAAGWTTPTQIRREYYFTDGAITVRGKLASRGKKKFADYVLMYEANLPLAIIEAKANTQAVGAGLQQALAYAKALDVPFVFSCNGDAFLFHDRIAQADDIEVMIPLEQFPSPDELWNRYRAWKGLDEAATALARQPYYEDPREGAQGVLLSALEEQIGAEMDPFDLICHIVYGQPPLTRRERAVQVSKHDVFTRYGEAARTVPDALLDKGIAPIEDIKVLQVQPFRQMGSARQLVGHFGRRDYLAAVRSLEAELYAQPNWMVGGPHAVSS